MIGVQFIPYFLQVPLGWIHFVDVVFDVNSVKSIAWRNSIYTAQFAELDTLLILFLFLG